MGLLARFYGGALPIKDMMRMTIRELLFWYDNYLLQSIEEEVTNEKRYDDKGNIKKLPKPEVIRAEVLARIKKIKEGDNGDQ